MWPSQHPTVTDTRLISIALVLVIVVPVTGVYTVQSNEYQLTSSDSVNIPEQTVSIDGDEYTVDSFATVRVDGTVTVQASGPDGVRFDILLYNSDEQIVASDSVEGSQTLNFDLSSFDSGTYTFVIDDPDGEIQAVLPLIIEGYAIDVDLPSEVTTRQNVQVSAELTRLDGADTSPETVEINIIRNGETEFVEMERIDDSTYQTTISFNSPGVRDLIVGVRGGDVVDGKQELLAVSDQSELTVITPTPSPTPTETEPPSNPPSGGSDSSPTQSPVTTTSEPSKTTQMNTPIPTDSVSSSPTSSPTDTPGGTTTGDSPTSQSQSSDATTTTPPTESDSPPSQSDVLTPTFGSSAPPTESTEVTTPLHPMLLVIAIMVFVTRRIVAD